MVSRTTEAGEQEPSSRWASRRTVLIGIRELLTRTTFRFFLALLLAYFSSKFTAGFVAPSGHDQFGNLPQREGSTGDVATLSYGDLQPRPNSVDEALISGSPPERRRPLFAAQKGFWGRQQTRHTGSGFPTSFPGTNRHLLFPARPEAKRVVVFDDRSQKEGKPSFSTGNPSISTDKSPILHGAHAPFAAGNQPAFSQQARDGSGRESENQAYRLAGVGPAARLGPQLSVTSFLEQNLRVESERRAALKNGTSSFAPGEHPPFEVATVTNGNRQPPHAESIKEFCLMLASSAKMHISQFVSEFLAPWTRRIVGTCLSTTSFISFILLIVYLYFAVRIFALCRALRLQSVLNSGRAARSRRTRALAKRPTRFPEDGLDTEWILRGWQGTALTALSGFGEPWEHVISKAAAARREQRKLQGTENPLLGCSADRSSKAHAVEDWEQSAGAENVDGSKWGGSRCFEGPVSLHFSLSPYGSDSCCQTVFGSPHHQTVRNARGVLDMLETREGVPGEICSGDSLDTHEEPAFELAATYMQNRTFVWWGSYFVAACAFILLVLLMALEADQRLLSKAFLAVGGSSQLLPFWRLLAAVQWISALCLLRGILSDYNYATNGAFHGRQKFFLSVVICVLSLVFLSLLFGRGPSYPAECLGPLQALPPSSAAGPPSPEELSSPGTKKIGGYSSRREEGINAVSHREETPLSAFEFIAPESGAVLDPYTYGRATLRASTAAAGDGHGWPSQCADYARVSSYWLGLSVGCYLFLRLVCLCVVLSLATSEETFQQKRDSQATVSFSWLVAGVSFAFVDLFPFPLLALLSQGPSTPWFPVEGVDILLCSQCLCHLFFFKHVQRELHYATHSSIKKAIRKMQETFCLKSFD
ncbi:conserved hypothetical protein [Neospora caninum Liverpool]|uniref:C2H2-type domain-containing protein n=1 Tax=Neospora caninum (strain Liverpool) TaxID=572307 RepID=F0VP08_NEOCL|nr:conserved hypothetical protein [Neospora caninum Liverpool]CBZ55454.1 conserved hypothetical protein [Neospora caninum Liverpool]CEL70190.1 TPA: hypothetical protein BN1204_058770 [Neospora caninum Liverpool]|eukprot:XP_003885482.1 conserved hypothetical protein [Neospora caninum Liverpool]